MCSVFFLAVCVGLTVMYIYVIYKLISSKIWASQAKNSKAKPLAWEAVQASLSHVVNRKTQSAPVCMHKLFELLIKKLPLYVSIFLLPLNSNT
jgi:hypothetical protein